MGELQTSQGEEKPLNFLQRWKLQMQLDKFQKELSKVMKEDNASRKEQKEKLKVIVLDILSDSSLHLEDDICSCGLEDCSLKGEGHEKTHIEEVKEEDIELWSVEKTQKIILQFFDEMKIYLKENRKVRG